MSRPRLLVACEFSGVVRDAFTDAGFEAWSCDLLPTERMGRHIQGDVREVLGWGWDMMLAFPPCTFLCNSGVRWLYGGKGTERDPERWAAMEDAAAFFRLLLDAPIPHIAIENPVMHGYGKELIGSGPTQIIQPWQHGHPETKATGLWLRGLDPLTPTNIVPGRTPRVHLASPGPDRWKERSRTLPGIARAMADQFGAQLLRETLAA